MAQENFTTWTEGDPNSRLSVTASAVTATNLYRDDGGTWVYKDFGSDHFNGDFEHRFKFNIDTAANYSVVFPWLLTNTVNEPNDIDAAGGDFQGVCYYQQNAYTFHLYPLLCENGTLSQGYGTVTNTVQISYDTDYFITVTRTDAGGVNSTGQLKLEVYTTNYSGESGAVEVGTTTRDCGVGEQNDFQYLFSTCVERASGATFPMSGVVSNFDLQESPIVYEDISGGISATGTLTGALSGAAIDLEGSISAISSLSGSLGGFVSIGGTISATASLSGVVTAGPLAGAKAEKSSRRLVAIGNDCVYYENL